GDSCTVRIDLSANLGAPGERSFTTGLPAAEGPVGVTGVSATTAAPLTVDPRAQTINFAGPGDTPLSASPLTLFATASSGLSVSFGSATPSICTVDGTSLTLLQMGTCTVEADQTGNTLWAPAPTVSRSFTVTPPVFSLVSLPPTGLKVGV